MTDRVLTACGVIACEAAGIPPDFASALIWRTPPRGLVPSDRRAQPRVVHIQEWTRAREVFAAELVHQGWPVESVADLLDVEEEFVTTSRAKYAERFEPQDLLPELNN